MSTAIPIADIGQKYPVTISGLTLRKRNVYLLPGLKFCSPGELKMLKALVGCGAAAACLIGSAQPAHAAPTDCWFFTETQQYNVEAQDCDVTRRTEPSDRTTSGYLNTWIIRDASSTHILEAVLWDDESAEYTFLDRRGNVTSRVNGTWWTDSDGDTRLEFGVGNDGVDYSMAFTRPSSDYGSGAAYPPAFSGPTESYQPVRGGGLSSGEFSDRPFRF